jgi:hypothetical protein
MYCRLQVSERLTAGIEFSLLPTPLANPGNRTLDDKGESRGRDGNRYGVNLSQLAKAGLLPTPKAVMIEESIEQWEARRQKGKTKFGPSLHVKVNQLITGGLLPTPTASSDSKGGCTRPDPKRQKDSLAHAMHGVLGTPGKTSQLSPRFVAEMMGFPVNWTESPFLPGEKKA